MASKSEARIQGRRGQEILKGRALSASHISLLEKFADQNHRENGAGRAEKDCEIDKKACDMSFKPTSNGGSGGQKDLQVEKVAEKLALLCPKYDEKVKDRAGRGKNGGAGADFENSNVIQPSQELCEISLKTTSNGDCGENTSLLKALQVKLIS